MASCRRWLGSAELREPERKRGEREVAARGRRRGGGLGFWGAARGSCRGTGAGGEGPGGGAPCRVSAFGGGTVTRTTGWDPLAREREREAGRLAVLLLRAARVVVGDWAGPFGWPGCLPHSFSYSFFLFFLFSDFCTNRKRRVFGGIFL